MGWPFGPPHLTLKPSKQKQKQLKKKNIKNKQQQQKTKNKKKEKWKINKTNQTYQKNELFSYQSKFSFLGRCPKIPFFDNLAQKKRTPKTL